MDNKLRQVSRLLKRYDSDLQAKRCLNGALAIYRKQRAWDFYQFKGVGTVWFPREIEDVVLPVTDTWLPQGNPVDWGIEPILWKIQELDAWRDDSYYERFCEDRDARKRNKDRAWRNEVRAIAADARRDFAKSVNNINTSTLEKVDNRRKKDGYRR